MVSGCIQCHAFVTFKHSTPRAYQETEDSGRPNRCSFSSLGYCVRISRHWRALFQNGQISLLWSGVVNRILPSNAHFAGAIGIVLKHSMDTTRHVFCSRSVRISFERICFRLHPASSLRYVQTVPKPNSIPRNGRCLDTQITYIISGISASFCHSATADIFRATGERRIQMGTARWMESCLQTPFFSHAAALHWSTAWTQHDMCSALRPPEYPWTSMFQVAPRVKPSLPSKHSQTQGHTKKPKISGYPDYIGGIGAWRCFAPSWNISNGLSGTKSDVK